MTREERAEAVVVELLDADPGYTVAALKAALIAFADAEAAAMRERAAMCATNEARADENGKAAKANALIIAAAIRALPATGEVGRG